MTFADDFNAGSPGSPLVGSSYARIGEVIYTAAGRGGSVGIADGGLSNGAGGYFEYVEETDTLVAKVDFIYTSGDGTFPISGAIGGAGVVYLYGVDASNNYIDIFQYNVGVDANGGYHEAYDYVTPEYEVYPLTGGGWTSDFNHVDRSKPAFDAWRTARVTLADGTFTFDLVAEDGATVIWSYSMAMPGSKVTAFLGGLGWDSTHDRRVNLDNFSYVTEPAPPPPPPVVRGVQAYVPAPRRPLGRGGPRYLARRIVSGEWLHRDLPLTDVERTRVLSGPTILTATLDPELRFLMADDGLRVLEDWATMIYVQSESGRLLAHGIVLPPQEYDEDETRLSCAGVSSYLHGSYYDGSHNWGPDVGVPRPDPLQIVQDLWEHAQSFPDTNLGVRVVGKLKSRVRIGSYEDPYRLRWWEAPDLGAEIDELAESTPFDYIEEVEWANENQTEVDHRVRLGWPRLGRSRSDLRFVLGENIIESVPVRTSEMFANDVRGIGNGTGAKMVTARSTVRDGRLRRTMIYTDKTIRSEDRLARRVRRLQAAMQGGRTEISEVVIRDHPNARIDAINPGDDILVQTYVGGYGEVNDWSRVVEIRQGDDESVATLGLVSATRFTYSPSQPGDTEDTPPAPTIVRPLPVAHSTVGTSFASAGYGAPTTSIALPAGTQAGDLIVVALLGGFEPEGQANCTDSRMTQVHVGNLWGRPTGVWAGYADADGNNPVAIELLGQYSVYGQFSKGMAAVLRGDGRQALYDPSRIAETAVLAGNSGDLPALAGYGSGAVAVVFASGGIGGAYGFGWEEAPIYSHIGADGSYAVVSMGVTHDEQVIAQPTPTDDSGDGWLGVVVGLK